LLPANAILLRDAGDTLPQAPPFKEVYGLNMASIVEMPVERGIAKVLGLSLLAVVDYPQGVDKRTLLEKEAHLAAKALEEYDGVYVHLKGPDEPGHDGDFEGKVNAIEEIDRYFFGVILDKIDLERTIIIVTSDHATPWYLKAHSDDPVPLMFSNPELPEKHEVFSEVECQRGTLGVLEGGYKIIPTLLDVISKL
jgi:2,3-bisphosphoglycerate-independent phosphoglycerate mutase